MLQLGIAAHFKGMAITEVLKPSLAGVSNGKR
jgi:hypothetical protein